MKGLLTSFFPASTLAYWYYSAYFPVCFAEPLLNQALTSFTRGQLVKFLFAFFIIFCIIGSTPHLSNTIQGTLLHGYSAIWLGYLYLVGAALRIHGIQNLLSELGIQLPSQLKPLRDIFYIVLFCLATAMILISKITGKVAISWYTSPVVLCQAICLLKIFAYRSYGQRICRFVAFLAPMTFSVYLIHDHPIIRQLLMRTVGSFLHPDDGAWLLLTVPLTAAVIYAICSIFELVRRAVFTIVASCWKREKG